MADSAFLQPQVGQDPQQQLLCDFRALWSLHDEDVESREAATLALLFMRRHNEIFAGAAATATEQERFEERLRCLCLSVCEAYGGEAPRDHRFLAQLLLNYAATIWLTWYTMPVERTSALEDTVEVEAESMALNERRHDLTADEAQMGILVLVQRFLDNEVVPPAHVPSGRH